MLFHYKNVHKYWCIPRHCGVEIDTNNQRYNINIKQSFVSISSQQKIELSIEDQRCQVNRYVTGKHNKTKIHIIVTQKHYSKEIL